MDENFLKLTNTTYKLLEYFPEADPLAARAKERILEVVENFVLASSDLKEQQKLQGKIVGNIDIILGFLEVGKINGWISPINYLIVSNEFKKAKLKFGVVEQPDTVVADGQNRTQIGSESVSEKIEAQKIEAPNFLIKLTDRQKKILEFLKEKEKAQVMDLQAILPTITKRTIRRDLDELLALRKVVRMGEFNQVFYQTNVK